MEKSSPPRATVAPSRAPCATTPAPGAPSTPAAARVLALPAACAALLIAFGLLLPQRPGLFWTFVGAGGVLLAWTAVLYATAHASGRALAFDVVLRKQHWVQACAQGGVLLYWGWHVRFVYAFLPLVAAQLVFAYAVDSLLSWSRRDRYLLGFGPFPVILSINLFLWFRPEWFYWQFAMIMVGYAAKEFIRWNRDGRSAHIFNPSSFPLGVASLILILTASTDITLGTAIASTQFYPPHIYLAIFLLALPGQLLFGVARMTMSAVITLYLISMIYLQATGTYLFFDSTIPITVFLGMHLLFTDPSTSPRSGSGRIAFGALYAIGTAAFYVVLGALGVPTFYDKLLPVPLLNLTVRVIDRLAASFPLRRAPVRATAVAAPRRLYLGYTALWAAVFLALSATGSVGDHHPGQALPFWQNACREGSTRACEYTASMTRIYCDNGSGWACNQWGIMEMEAGRPVGAAFSRACTLGFTPACAYSDQPSIGHAPPPRSPPMLADLPIVLRGTKRPLTERDPVKLYAIACRQGWPGTCRTETGASPQ